MNYNKGFKHVQKIAKNSSAGRPVLQGIKHTGSDIISTDSHRLLSFTDDKANFEDHLIHFKTGDIIEGVYPDISRLINNEDYSNEINIKYEEIEILRKMFKSGKTLKYENVILIDKPNLIDFKLNVNDNKSLLNKLDINYKLRYNEEKIQGEYEIILNLDYMIDLFDFLYDTGKDTVLKINDDTRPVHFTNKDYTYLILPIRRF